MTGKPIAPGRTRIKIRCMGSMEEVHLAIRCEADAAGLVGVTPPEPGPLLLQRLPRRLSWTQVD